MYITYTRYAKRTTLRNFLLSAVTVFLVGNSVVTQAVPPPIMSNIDGRVEEITLVDETKRYSAGTIRIGNRTIIIPANLVSDEVANRLTLQQIVTQGEAVGSPDTDLSVSILANKTVDNRLIAGELFVHKTTGAPGAGMDPTSFSGVVSFINGDGSFSIGTLEHSGLTVIRLNDPETRHTVQTCPWADEAALAAQADEAQALLLAASGNSETLRTAALAAQDAVDAAQLNLVNAQAADALSIANLTTESLAANSTLAVSQAALTAANSQQVAAVAAVASAQEALATATDAADALRAGDTILLQAAADAATEELAAADAALVAATLAADNARTAVFAALTDFVTGGPTTIADFFAAFNTFISTNATLVSATVTNLTAVNTNAAAQVALITPNVAQAGLDAAVVSAGTALSQAQANLLAKNTQVTQLTVALTTAQTAATAAQDALDFANANPSAEVVQAQTDVAAAIAAAQTAETAFQLSITALDTAQVRGARANLALSRAAAHPNCSADPRFTNDPDNYTFVATTGYPMCVTSPGTTTDGVEFCDNRGRVAGQSAVIVDSTRFAAIQVGDHVFVDGNFETIETVDINTDTGVVSNTFFSAHTIIVSAALTTAPGNPDFMIFDEVEWDCCGYQNERTRGLLIGFNTLSGPDSNVEVYAMHNSTDGEPNEVLIASTIGCDTIKPFLCTLQGTPPTTNGVFKIRMDVDFIEAPLRLATGKTAVVPKFSPCAQLGGLTIADYELLGVEPETVPCNTVTRDPVTNAVTDIFTDLFDVGKEFAVMNPLFRDLVGRTRNKVKIDAQNQLNAAAGVGPIIEVLDVTGTSVPWGQYINPVGQGHPEFGEIDLAAIDTPLIFTGQPWLLDRRLGPGGFDELNDNGAIQTNASLALDPFPCSGLDPREQAAVPATPVVPLGQPAANEVFDVFNGTTDSGFGANLLPLAMPANAPDCAHPIAFAPAAPPAAPAAVLPVNDAVTFRLGREIRFDTNVRTRLLFEGTDGARFNVCVAPANPAAGLATPVEIANDVRLLCIPVAGDPCIGVGEAAVERSVAEVQGLIQQDTFLTGDRLFTVNRDDNCAAGAATAEFTVP